MPSVDGRVPGRCMGGRGDFAALRLYFEGELDGTVWQPEFSGAS